MIPALLLWLFALSALFIFYTVRLLVVTGALAHTRPAGHGAYIGAIVFPVLAIGFAWGWYALLDARKVQRSGCLTSA